MTIQFEAAALYGVGEDLRMVEVSAEPLRPDEVLVRMVTAGICHTDLVVQRGAFPVPYPIVLGHEGSGVVEQVGTAVTDLAPGDPVGLSFMSCGACSACAAGRPAHCEHFGGLNLSGLRGDGTTSLSCDGAPIGGHFFGQSSFARHSVAHRRNVVKVRADMPLELVGPFGCGVQTGAGTIFNVLRPSAGESCAVFGGGTVGLSAVMAAKVVGCDPIILVEPQADRRALGLELGATFALDPAEGDIGERISEATGGGAKAIVDTTGMASVVCDAISALGRGGGLGLVGIHDMAAEARFSIAALLNKAASIHAIIEGDSDPQRFIPYLIDLYKEGRFPVDRLIGFYAFEDINQAIADQHAGLVIKPVLRFNDA